MATQTPPALARAAGSRLLAVALHDVAPQTWPACARLLNAIDTLRVATCRRVPVTPLVVPDYHGEGLRRFDAAYRGALEARLDRGDELALHGWRRRDEAPVRLDPVDVIRRTQLTAREGEFAALSQVEALARLQAGAHWF